MAAKFPKYISSAGSHLIGTITSTNSNHSFKFIFLNLLNELTCLFVYISTPYHKMAYSTSKSHFHEKLTGVFDIMAASTDDLEPVLGPPPVEEEEEDFDF